MKTKLDGKIILITGGTSGIGAAAATALKKRGATVIITGRSPTAPVSAQTQGFEYHRVDFARLSDVKEFAQNILQLYPRIDILANNVGGVMNKRKMTEDNHEMTFQVNHLGGFLLTQLLQKRLEESRALIINTSSQAHHFGKLNINDLDNAQGYSAFRAYGTAKLMNILHAAEINSRFKGVLAVSFHPGPVATGFGREGNWLVKWIYESPLSRLFLISAEKGADTLVWLAQADRTADLKAGAYYDKRKPGKKSAQAQDSNLARLLWDASQAMLGRFLPNESR